MKCLLCGSDIPDNAAFCPQCGSEQRANEGGANECVDAEFAIQQQGPADSLPPKKRRLRALGLRIFDYGCQFLAGAVWCIVAFALIGFWIAFLPDDCGKAIVDVFAQLFVIAFLAGVVVGLFLILRRLDIYIFLVFIALPLHWVWLIFGGYAVALSAKDLALPHLVQAGSVFQSNIQPLILMAVVCFVALSLFAWIEWRLYRLLIKKAANKLLV